MPLARSSVGNVQTTVDQQTGVRLGAHTSIYDLDGAGVSPKVTNPMDTHASGSSLVIMAGLNRSTTNAPVHNKTGTVVLAEGIDYTVWTPFGVEVYTVENFIGGAGTTVSITKTGGDTAAEISIIAVEVIEGGAIVDTSIVETTSGSTATTASVTTTDDALLICSHWGDQGVSGAKSAAPQGTDWTMIEYSQIADTAYVQHACAVRKVTGAGTYSITWNHSPVQRAIMTMVAVQKASNPITVSLVGARGVGAANTATTTGGTTQATGSTFAFYVSYDASAGTITTAGDNKGNTYTAVGTPQADEGFGGGGLGRWYVCQNGVGGTSHTATFATSASSFAVIHLFEIRNATLTPLDQNAQGTDGTSPYTLTSPTLSQANELVLVGCNQNSGTPGDYASSNFTMLSFEPDTNSYWTSGVAYQVVSATTAVTPSLTRANSGGGAGLSLITFRQAA